MKRILWAGLLAIFSATSAYADDVKVSNAWARATAPGQDTASVQLTITSKKAATLVGAASGSAQSVEIHSMAMEGEMMQMRQIDELPLPAKTRVSLGQGDCELHNNLQTCYHLMLIGLRKPLTVGHKLPFALTVKFADGKTTLVRVLAEVRPLETTSDEGHEHNH